MNVDLLHDIYEKSLLENEKNIIFWENHLQNLDKLDLNIFSENLTVPVLVPLGSRILFWGELKHTNEVTVALGADYFAKCSVNQANILKQRRIKDAKSNLEVLNKERDYLQSQLSFSKQKIQGDAGYDIIEVVTDEEDQNWRKLHRENVRQYKQRKDEDDEDLINKMSNEELWNRLEELELQEELENELAIDENIKCTSKEPSSIVKAGNAEDSDDDDGHDAHVVNPDNKDNVHEAPVENEIYLANYGNRIKLFHQPSKLHLFELVVDRHNAIKEMVAEMRARQRQSRNEDDLVEIIDDMERLEELEDKIAILEDMLASDDDYIEEAEEEEYGDNQLKKSVAFADEDNSETFEITFKHSEEEPSRAPYEPENGITKPSDIYEAYSSFFNGETTSILKKAKCVNSRILSKTKPIKEKQENDELNQDSNLNSTIIVKDVVEKFDCNDYSGNNNVRPMSLFKRRRQLLKE